MPISTKEKMNNFTGTKTKITSAIPEFNIEENQVNKEILNKISELNQKIKDGVEGKSSTKNLEISYIGYGNNIVVSLLLDVTEAVLSVPNISKVRDTNRNIPE